MTSSPTDDPAVPRSARFRTALLVVLVVALLAATGVTVWLLADRALPGRDSGAVELQRERDAVMAQARQFMLRSQTYSADDLADDGTLAENREQVTEVVTDKFGAAYLQSMPAIEAVVKEQGVSQSAKVLGVGVQYLDTDSARALVAGESTFTQDDEAGDPQEFRSQTFRVVVDLVKVDGEWLVDESEIFSDPAASPQPTPTPAPTPVPSEGATP